MVLELQNLYYVYALLLLLFFFFFTAVTDNFYRCYSLVFERDVGNFRLGAL